MTDDDEFADALRRAAGKSTRSRLGRRSNRVRNAGEQLEVRPGACRACAGGGRAAAGCRGADRAESGQRRPGRPARRRAQKQPHNWTAPPPPSDAITRPGERGPRASGQNLDRFAADAWAAHVPTPTTSRPLSAKPAGQSAGTRPGRRGSGQEHAEASGRGIRVPDWVIGPGKWGAGASGEDLAGFAADARAAGVPSAASSRLTPQRRLEIRRCRGSGGVDEGQDAPGQAAANSDGLGLGYLARRDGRLVRPGPG